jgi:hypothetical protein
MSAIYNIITNSFFTSLAIIGAGTIVAKVGVFLKTYEEEKDDAYKKAFDKTMTQTVDEVSFCIESVKKIATTTTKASSLASEIAMGTKILEKDKSGKLIVKEKGKMEETIDDLNKKVRKYQEELEAMKRTKSTKKKYEMENSDEENEEEYLLEQNGS